MSGPTVPEPQNPDLSRDKRRRRRGKPKENGPQNDGHTNNGTSNQNEVNQNQNQDQVREKKSHRKKWVPDDRYYGSFCCKLCRRRWDSALVFCVGGTKKVRYRQRCKSCTEDEAWVMPYHLELLRCQQCEARPCECLCQDCNKLKHKRYHMHNGEDESGEPYEERVLDEKYEYCDCEKQRDAWIEANIDPNKPHQSQLCEKCLKGRPCRRNAPDDDDPDHDNEP